MLPSDVLKLSLKNVIRGKTRTLLTVLSITIGIASILLVSSIGSTGESFVINEIEKMGLQGITIHKQTSDSGKELTDEDIDILKNRFKEIEAATPMIFESGSFKFGRSTGTAVLIGVGEEATSVYNIKVLHGKAPRKGEIKGKKRVVAIDDELALKTYKRTNVIGKNLQIKIGGKTEEFEIISVVKSQKDGINQIAGNNIPDFIYLPYTTLNDLRDSREISQIALKTSGNTANFDKFSEFLNKINNVKGEYVAENLSSKIDEVKSITGMISALITAIAAIALCVAGIGIMNSAFSSCIERKREIGISMAIGAKFSNILICFLTEAVIVSLIGGVCGELIGILLGKLASKLIGISFMPSFKMILISEIISILFGIVFSLLPAIKAASVDPIVALRRD